MTVETCRSVIIYKLIVIVLLLVILQNNKNAQYMYQNIKNKIVPTFVLKGWQLQEFIPSISAIVMACSDNKAQSHLLVLELVHCLRMHSWNTALEMTSHTDRSRNSGSLRQTLSDGTGPVQLNCTSHILF